MLFLTQGIYGFFYPEKMRWWFLRLYERYTWMSSERKKNQLLYKTVGELRFNAAVFSAGATFFYFKHSVYSTRNL
jgi:hypothetical protein